MKPDNIFTAKGVITGLNDNEEDIAAQRGLSQDLLDQTLDRIHEYGTAFSERTFAIVAALEAHPDQDCKFLAKRLSFSEFYKPRRDPKAKESNGTKEKSKEKDKDKEREHEKKPDEGGIGPTF